MEKKTNSSFIIVNNIYQSQAVFMYMTGDKQNNTLQDKVIKLLSSTFPGKNIKSIKNTLLAKNTLCDNFTHILL